MAREIVKKQFAAPKDSKVSLPEETMKKTRIRVIGIGGGGGNIVSEIASRVSKATFFTANTDKQALDQASKKTVPFQFGQNLTQGLGTGMNPRLAEAAALEEKEKIKKILQGQDLVILVAALGGGTGSGAAPVFAKISRGLGNHTLGIFTLPFKFEGDKKMEIAFQALEQVKPKLNAFVLLPNERIFQLVDKTTPLTKAFLSINKILADSLEGLIETVFDPGMINIDFADLRTVLSGQGRLAYLNTVQVPKSQNSTQQLIEKVLNSPLFSYNIKGAKGVLFNIAGPQNLELAEVSQISKSISDLSNKDAKIIFGISSNKGNPEMVKITLLATGCSLRLGNTQEKQKRRKKTKKSALKTIVEKVLPPLPAKAEAPQIAQLSVKKNGNQRLPLRLKRKEKKIKPVKPKKTAEEKKSLSQIEIPQMEKEEEKAGLVPRKEGIMAAIRKNALQVRDEIKREEEEILAKERIWETPAFLRRKKNQQN